MLSYQYQTPIEMPRGSHYGSDYWISYSYKLKRRVHFFSMLEFANFITLEMNPAVEFFCEQPLKISGGTSSLTQNSIFDFWIYYTDGSSEFQEIKYSSELEGDTDSALRSQKQIEFQKSWCISNGINYRVITEKELYIGHFWIQNLIILHSHLLRYNQINRTEPEILYKVLLNKTLNIKEISALKILPENCELSILAYQFYKGAIDMAIKDRPLDKYTEVKLCETKSIIS